ncbi:MAG: hypothetical protein WBZ19_20755 [Chthoniobacterales bacterium]
MLTGARQIILSSPLPPKEQDMVLSKLHETVSGLPDVVEEQRRDDKVK